MEKLTLPRTILIFSVLALFACHGPTEPRDGGDSDGGTLDAGSPDAGNSPDAGSTPDAGSPFDAGTPPDAGMPDTALSDTGHYVLATSSSSDGAALSSELDALLHDSAFLTAPGFVGIQVKLLWKDLETAPKVYSLAPLHDALTRAAAAHRKVFVQLQYITFDGTTVVPSDLLPSGELVNAGNGNHHARVWDGVTKYGGETVNQRFIDLIRALGTELSADEQKTLAGLALPETACSGCTDDSAYSAEADANAINAELDALRATFPKKPVIQYINFLPGAANQQAALEGIAAHACQIKAGLGVPDVRRHDPGSGPTSVYSPPGYPVLARYSGHVPENLSVQYADYLWYEQLAPAGDPQTGTYHLAVNEMGANYVNWLDVQGTPVLMPESGKLSFNLAQVYAYAHPLPTASKTVDWVCP